jgi:Domain of unknown function (DUF397)
MGNQQVERDWRKSSFSNTNGDCVEVAGSAMISVRDTGDWRKSTFSGTNGNCVEVARGAAISVRDTKDRSGAELTFTAAGWSAFTASLK